MGVTGAVVQLAEAVDVDRHDRHGPALAARAAQLDLESVLEGAVVENAGERVAQCQLVEAALGLGELGRDIGSLVAAAAATDREPRDEGSGDGGCRGPRSERPQRGARSGGDRKDPQDPRMLAQPARARVYGGFAPHLAAHRHPVSAS